MARNRETTEQRRLIWLDTYPDAVTLRDWLFGQGEFEGKTDLTGVYHEHPLHRGIYVGNFGQFLAGLRDQLITRGHLSERQTQIVRDSLAKKRAWAAERAVKAAAEAATSAATSRHVGFVGSRQDFDLRVQWVKRYEGTFGATYFHGLKDLEGNVVIYKGSKCLGRKDDAIRVKATVIEHGIRDGIAQTVISRPATI